jgi:hypothetical protein
LGDARETTVARVHALDEVDASANGASHAQETTVPPR